jgi:hypothetical protein
MATTLSIGSSAVLAIGGVMLALSSLSGVLVSDSKIDGDSDIVAIEMASGLRAVVFELPEDTESWRLVFDERDTDEDDEGRGWSIQNILRPYELERISHRLDYLRQKVDSRAKIPLV